MINEIRDNVFQLHFSNFGSCVYVLKLNVAGEEKAVLIDTSTSDNKEELFEDLEKLNLKPEGIDYILLTHGHYDHVENVDVFPNAKVLKKDEVEKLGIKVFETPGHTSDSVCYLYEGVLFSGDTLFHNGIGRTDLPTGNYEKMVESLKFLRDLDFDILCPGHI